MSFLSWPTPASPTTSSPPRQPRPNFQYDLSDIDRAHSISYVSRLGQEPRDPLAPVYRLATRSSPEQAQADGAARFIRDAMSVDDLPGARPKTVADRMSKRSGMRSNTSSLDTRDIPGTQPKVRWTTTTTAAGSPTASLSSSTAIRPRTSTSLQSHDITHTRFQTSRCTNPLQPEYEFGRECGLDKQTILESMRRENGERSGSKKGKRQEEEKEPSPSTTHILGPISGSHPRQLPQGRQNPEHIYNLRTNDISSLEAKQWSWTKPQNRDRVRDPTTTLDIPGAQPNADRTKMSVSQRRTDPNERNYSEHGLGGDGKYITNESGMLHVHRHILDYTPHAEKWKAVQPEPAQDAAGAMKKGEGQGLTAGMMQPRKRAVVEAVAVAVPTVRKEFGAPAEDEMFPQSDYAQSQQRNEQRSLSVGVSNDYGDDQIEMSSPMSSGIDDERDNPIHSDIEYSPIPTATVNGVEPSPKSLSSSATNGSTSSSPYLSLPPNTHKIPTPQKRHFVSAPSTRYTASLLAGSSSLSSLPPNTTVKIGSEYVAIDPSRRGTQGSMAFGVRTPFGVPQKKASIEEAQSVGHSRNGSHVSSRPSSKTRMMSSSSTNGLDATLKANSTFALGATAVTNAFSMTFNNPVSTANVGLNPYSASHSSSFRPPRSLDSTQMFERGAKANGERTLERRIKTQRDQEIQSVRALA